MIDIVMIGHGAIGSYVAKHLARCSGARIRWVLCREGREEAALKAVAGAPGARPAAVNDLDEIEGPVDLAIECAGHLALARHGPAILARGIDLIAVSNGALAEDGLAEKLEAAAVTGKSRLHLMAGAVGAIDAIAAAHAGGLDTVVYRGRKPPSGWRGSAAETVADLDGLTAPLCHFTGTARAAALEYPKNANVAATVALAGIGLDDTRVELIADPGIAANIHEIEAAGRFGKLKFAIEGKPLDGNPKSSALTAMSVVRAVRNRLLPVVI